MAGGRIYVVGGVNLGFTDRLGIYDSGLDSWSVEQSAPAAFAAAESCIFSDEIYFIGGRTTGNAPVEAFVYTYNPATDSWSAKSPMELGREGHQCVTMGDELYVMGGPTGTGSVLDLVGRYDPLLDLWESPSRLPTGRHWFSASAIGDQIFTFGGANGHELLDVVEILDISALHDPDSLWYSTARMMAPGRLSPLQRSLTSQNDCLEPAVRKQWDGLLLTFNGIAMCQTGEANSQ